MIYASNDGIIRVKKEDFKKFNYFLKKILKKENDVRRLLKRLKNKDNYQEQLHKFLNKSGRW